MNPFRRRQRVRLDRSIPRSRIRTRDLFVEAWAAVTRRPVRSLLTALGTIAGTAAFTATLGIAATASAQISERFDLLKATEVRVQDTAPNPDIADIDPAFPADVDERLERLNGVNTAGLYWTLQPSPSITRLPGRLDPDQTGQGLTVIAATPGAIQAAQPEIVGRNLDQGHLTRNSHVALIGTAAARQLGITRIDNTPAIYLNDVPYTLIGIINDVARNPDLLLAITIPTTTAQQAWGPPASPPEVLIDVQPGAAQLIGTQAALALRPHDPARLQVLVPPEPKTLRRGVEGDTKALYLTLAILALAIGTIGITNATLVAVLERTHEIGLRRALGAQPRHIATQLITETALLGTTGGLIGTTLGTLATITVAITNQWTPTTPTWTLLTTPLLGTITGITAGLQPARKAAQTAPVESLRA
jgi:putative ABC transport system permease protein